LYVPKSRRETQLFKIARLVPSPLGPVRHGNKCKTQKERVGEAKNNDHNLLLRPRGRVFREHKTLKYHAE
jgi:hypothetical protein